MGYTFRNSDLLLGRYSGSFFKEQIISPNSGSIILFDKNLNPNVVTTSSLFFSKLSASRLYVDKSASINNLRVTGPTTLIGQLTASSTRINGNVNVIGSVKAVSFTGSFSGSINSSNVNGTANYIPKFTSANSVGNSVIYQSGNNIGIGTTSPLQKLSIVSGSALLASNALAGELYFGTDGSNIYLKRDNSYDLSLVQNGDSNSKLYLAGAGNVYVSIDSNNNDTDKAFIVQNNAIKAGTELFRVQENGNVGINTTSPGAKLDVSGSSKNILFNLRSPSSANILYVSGSGNVGIGTNTPAGKLDVNGNVIATSFTGSFSGSNARFGKLTGSGVRITGPTVVVGNTTIGDASSDTLTVVATSNFTGPFSASATRLTSTLDVIGQADFFGNVNVGDASSDTLIVNATSTFNNPITASSARYTGNVVIGDASSDTLKITSTTTFNNQVTASAIRVTSTLDVVGATDFFGNVIVGDASSDTLTVNATSTFNAPTTFTQLTGSISGSRARFGQITGSELRVNGDIRFGGEITVQPTRATSSDGFNLNIFGGDAFIPTRPGGNLILRGGYGTDGSGSVILKDSVQIGDTTANQDSLTVYSTTNFIGKISGSNIRITGNTVIGDASSDTLKVNATTTFFGPLTSSNLRTNGRLHVSSSASGAAFIVSTANQGGTNDTNAAFIVTGSRVGIMTDDVDYTLEVNGSFAATTKSFVINYKNKPGSKLVHASLEGPEHGVYYRGNTTSSRVNLPEYWNWLVKDDNINIILTSNKRYQELYVENIVLNTTSSYFTVKERGIKGWFNRMIKKPLNYSYLVNAERKDVPPLEVELKKRKHRK